ncbi:MFS transporter [Streptomyces sp. NPDC056528]|uniref:MFS transporter n=1 Tax=Streptomyces sp. NPDC056528 TaxID=3345854 RepID=UPI0036BB1CEB
MTQKIGPGYWTLLASVTVSSLGDGIRLVAMPLLAYSLTGSAVDISFIMVVAALPGLVLGPVVGVVVDRFDRRRVLLASNLLSAALALVFAAVITADAVELWQVYAMTGALAIADLFAESTTFAMISVPVPPELLEKANSRFFSVRMLTQQVIGSPVASVLFGVAMSAPFLAEGGLFLAAGVIVLFVPVLKRPPTGPGPEERRDAEEPRASIPAQMREGFRIIRRIPMLRAILLSDALLNFWMLIATALMVVFAKEELGLNDTQFALMFSAAALGGVLGGALLPPVVRRVGVQWTMVLTLVVTGAGRLALGLASGPWLVIGTFFVCGASYFMWDVAVASYQQRVTPNHLQGRVHATTGAFVYGAAVVAALTGGVAAELVGVRAVFVTGAVAVLLLSAYWVVLARRGEPGDEEREKVAVGPSPDPTAGLSPPARTTVPADDRAHRQTTVRNTHV